MSALRIASPGWEPKPGEHFMTVQELGSGWAAVEMWINNEHAEGLFGGGPLPDFPEPYDTGIGRYATENEAREEAEFLARDNNFIYIAPRANALPSEERGHG